MKNRIMKPKKLIMDSVGIDFQSEFDDKDFIKEEVMNHVADMIEDGYTSGELSGEEPDYRGWWKVSIEEDENDKETRDKEVAKNIRNGNTSGYYPTYTFSANIWDSMENGGGVGDENKTVFTKDGVEVVKGNNEYKGHIFYDEEGKGYECMGYFKEIDDCKYMNLQTGNTVVGCMDGFYFNEPTTKKMNDGGRVGMKWIFDSVNNRVVTEDDSVNVFYTDKLECPNKVIEKIVSLHNEGKNDILIDHYLLHEGECSQEDREFIVDGIYSFNYPENKMGNGGSVPNNYEGKTKVDIWDSWDEKQRLHFLIDHKDLINRKYFKHYPIDKMAKLDWNSFRNLSLSLSSKYELESPMAVLYEHTKEGQYEQGGGLKKFFTKAKDYGKKGLEHTKKYGKIGLEKSKHYAGKAKEGVKEGYGKAKKYTEDKIHDQKKKIALGVIDQTIDNVKSRDERHHLVAAEEIVDLKYATGGGVGEFSVGDILKYKSSDRYVTVISKMDNESGLYVFYSDSAGQAVTDEEGYGDVEYIRDFENLEMVGHRELERVTKHGLSYYKSGSPKLDVRMANLDGVRNKFFWDNAPKNLKSKYDSLENDNWHYATAELVSDFFNHPTWAHIKSHKLVAEDGMMVGELESPVIPSKYNKTDETIIIENINNNEVSVEVLKNVLNREPKYPHEFVGAMKLEKCFLRPYYRVVS